jgi:hypothetical protein
MKETLFLVLLMLFCYTGRSQDCHCPTDGIFGKEGKLFKTFSFRNKKSMGLCGYSSDSKNKHTIYSGMDLVQCDQNKLIQEWDETEQCEVEKIADTVFVKELYGVPIGGNFSEVWIPFYINKFFFNESGLQHITFFRRDVKKYSNAQIAQVFQKYKRLHKENSEEIVAVANMLFWACVSGSKNAEIYLKKFKADFGPFDGAIAEEWDDISATYELWKEKNKHG